ncbi:uncharacterized protein LOC129313500 [Prosopis cineraria]|uniref:uncharacterized protein LOC129313500 n=1 Tax=Prosopis cineraria TaxID=364024 RepID=UPI00240F3E63|nr:uncharacterized protein LOC129313500 [Prosopis cineraria]XP_054812661.1 uncharacterized protein LOC129313500 [Prosopis cineraria]XP_054812662.1 uncharacterized protein LOC129313500 [Prosopis cineraria]XP_054812663.1 uncharacterized protein LOC129313500 [Prosopis cineraria]
MFDPSSASRSREFVREKYSWRTVDPKLTKDFHQHVWKIVPELPSVHAIGPSMPCEFEKETFKNILSKVPDVKSIISRASGATADLYVEHGDNVSFGDLFLGVGVTASFPGLVSLYKTRLMLLLAMHWVV